MTQTNQSKIDAYSVEKLMHETRHLAAKYRETTGTVLPVTGEIARFDAAKALQLKLIDDPSSPIDAIGTGAREGKKILIKGRAIFETTRSSPRIGQLNTDQDWDNVVLVLFNDHYEPEEIYEATRQDIIDTMKPKDSNRKKRGAMSIAQFKIISQLVWTMENGLENEVWENQADDISS